MPLRDTFRVGQIMSGDCITLTANNDTCLLAMNECATGEIQCIHQSSMGGRMVSNVGLRRLEEGEQKPVLTGRKSKRRFRTYRNGDAPDTVTKERCRE